MMSSIIGSIMSNYNPAIAKERRKPINTIKQRVKKFMFTRSRSNAKEFEEAIAIANAVWVKAVNHFAEHGLKIDAVSTVVNLYGRYEESLSKHANINSKQIEAYSYNPVVGLSIEEQSNLVSEYILDELALVTGVQRKKFNLLSRIKK